VNARRVCTPTARIRPWHGRCVVLDHRGRGDGCLGAGRPQRLNAPVVRVRCFAAAADTHTRVRLMSRRSDAWFISSEQHQVCGRTGVVDRREGRGPAPSCPGRPGAVCDPHRERPPHLTGSSFLMASRDARALVTGRA
jgi:hypothetical protein